MPWAPHSHTRALLLRSQPSQRRESVVGVLKHEGPDTGGALFLVPCDPRLPRMLVRPSQLPESLKEVSE
jgi:hypothetical protein